MRLKVFDIIDETLDVLEKNKTLYKEVEKELITYIKVLFQNDIDEIIDFNTRIKSSESLREKIIRNRFYVNYTNAEDILANLSDLVGCIVQCRFIEDEFQIYRTLKRKLTMQKSDGYFYTSGNPYFCMDLSAQQPQIQKNGFSIYRIDGYYEKDGNKVNFELQIKALVNSFWGEIEHKLVYKNTNFYVYDDFMKDLLASIKANLTIMDRQLNIVYNQMQNVSKGDVGITENSFEKIISKAINDLFALKMNESIGFTLNLKNTSMILGHYIFVKDIRFDGGNNDRISSLFRTFKKMNSMRMDFENEIELDSEIVCKDPFSHILGNYLLKVINEDYDWFVFFNMLFAVEPGNNMEDFALFLSVIRKFMIDNYWLNTSFIRLSMEESELIHTECEIMLASALVEIGSIKIIHSEIMNQVRHAFVNFVEELEERVISYDDFMQYRKVYYEEWLRRVKEFF